MIIYESYHILVRSGYLYDEENDIPKPITSPYFIYYPPSI